MSRSKTARTLLLAIIVALAVSGGAAAKPLVVLLADARGTVATDLMAPYAILAESGAVEVKVVSATPNPVRLTPGYAWVAPQMTLTELARQRPDGPDVVIVSALEVVDDAARSAWLRSQVQRGARLMSICNGAQVLAAADLLHHRQATVHWYSQKKVARRYPEVLWRRDLRWVTDGPITTTAGISASEPATLDLLRQLAGDAVMRKTASRLGLPTPDQRHQGDDFHLTAGAMGLVVANRLAFWRHENVALPLIDGMDELAFGTALDAWSRTYRSTAWAAGPATATTRRGLTLYRGARLPSKFERRVVLPRTEVIGATFKQIGRAYGEATARFVALQFEHPYGAVGATRPAPAV